MLTTALNHTYLRHVYLRGITLGASWDGADGDAAMDSLLALYLARAEAILGVIFCRHRILTTPDVGMTLGTDYEIEAALLPYLPLVAGEASYPLTLRFPHVQSVERIRVRSGATYTTIPLSDAVLSDVDGRLRILASAVPAGSYDAWAIDYTIGLGQIPPEVVEWVGLQVAIAVLGTAGASADLGGGVGAQSLDQDGIVERIEYGGGGTRTYGLYSGPIRMLQDRLNDVDLAKWRMRYQGMRMPMR